MKSCASENLANILKGKSLLDAIELVEREATAVERRAFRNKVRRGNDLCVEELKATIMYLRYGVRSSKLPAGVPATVASMKDFNA